MSDSLDKDRIIALAVRVFGDSNKAMHWLNRRSLLDARGDRYSLMSQLDTLENARDIEERLYQIQHGLYR